MSIMPKLTSNQLKNKSTVTGTTVTEALNVLKDSLITNNGDMNKSVYDVNNNGVVDTAEVANTVAWTGVSGKPSTFTPSAHNHSISEVTNLQATLDSKASSTHSHSIGDVTGLQTALDGKQSTLVSGTNIKTVNGSSLLGSGDLVISGGGGGSGDVTGPASSTDSNFALFSGTSGKILKDTGVKASDFAAASHTHTASQISDSTTVGRNVLTATDSAAARTAIGAGTSNLVIGTTAGTALEGNTSYQAPLVSGTNIKTINGSSILGSGDLTISGGGGGLTLVEVTGTSVSATNGNLYALTNAAATTVTAPAFSAGHVFGVLVCNGRTDNVINWNSAKHENISDATMTLSNANAAVEAIAINATYGWKLK